MSTQNSENTQTKSYLMCSAYIISKKIIIINHLTENSDVFEIVSFKTVPLGAL